MIVMLPPVAFPLDTDVIEMAEVETLSSDAKLEINAERLNEATVMLAPVKFTLAWSQMQGGYGVMRPKVGMRILLLQF